MNTSSNQIQENSVRLSSSVIKEVSPVIYYSIQAAKRIHPQLFFNFQQYLNLSEEDAALAVSIAVFNRDI